MIKSNLTGRNLIFHTVYFMLGPSRPGCPWIWLISSPHHNQGFNFFLLFIQD